jgi:cytochrome P450
MSAVRDIASSGKKSPAGPRGHFLFGTLPEVQRDILSFVERVSREYGNIAQVRLLPGWHCLMLTHPDHYKHVLIDHSENYEKNLAHFDIFALLAGEGMLTLNGKRWRARRKLTQPAFHRNRILGFGKIMTEATMEMLQRWRTLDPSAALDIEWEMINLTLGIAARSLLTVDFTGELDAVGKALGEATRFMAKRWANPLSLYLVNLPTPENRAFAAAIKTLDDFVYRIIAARRKSGEDSGDVLSMLLAARDEETGDVLTDRELRDELMTVLIAGHETSSSALTWAWYLLGKNPEVEERLHQELKSVLDGRTPTIDDLTQLKYTRGVFEESLRMFTPGYIIGRRAMADDEIDGFPVPKGTAVYLAPFATHRDPAYWDRPDEFDPTRFFEARSASRPPTAFMPFGSGPRICMGAAFARMELQLVIATTAQQFRLRLASQEPVKRIPLVTIRPQGGMPMKLTSRH